MAEPTGPAKDQKIRVAVIGASGFTGGEVIRLLLNHPQVELAFLSAERSAGKLVGNVHPWLRNHPRLAGIKLRPLSQLGEVDVAFTCLPTGTLPEQLPLIAQHAKFVVNLAGDFRLTNPQELAKHYPASVANPPADTFNYYIPDLSESLPEGRFINLPGCMAVSTIYALYPLFAQDLVEPQVVVDAKTGSTGGGRGGGEHPAERSGNFRVHKPYGHRHLPEIKQAITEFTGSTPELRFSTHSLDVPRGILISAYSTLKDGVGALDVKRAYAKAYAGKAFVRVRPSPKAPQDYPMLKAVVGSNIAEVAVAVEGKNCVSIAAIDNLIKGAAGQAIQAMNTALGYPEWTGLNCAAVAP